MITKLRLIYGDGFDPYRNLAVEQVLLEQADAGECILYLWQNRQTVVIGRNQNAWRECRLSDLTQDSGHMARRLSGGGAVFHDLGNLNFTFLVQKKDYDLEKQLGVVVEACRSLGIPAEKSGRNDVLSGGRKFSGNAFYDTAGRAYHHGTLLVDVDMGALERYLRPSRAKLESKGVESVRSRVVNLRELKPDLTIEALKSAMANAFESVYGLKAQLLETTELDTGRVSELTERNESWKWLLGQRLAFTVACEQRFPWGELELEFKIENGIVEDVCVWTDAMDWSFAQPLGDSLRGARFSSEGLAVRLYASGIPPEIRNCAMRLLTEQAF